MFLARSFVGSLVLALVSRSLLCSIVGHPLEMQADFPCILLPVMLVGSFLIKHNILVRHTELLCL